MAKAEAALAHAVHGLLSLRDSGHGRGFSDLELQGQWVQSMPQGILSRVSIKSRWWN